MLQKTRTSTRQRPQSHRHRHGSALDGVTHRCGHEVRVCCRWAGLLFAMQIGVSACRGPVRPADTVVMASGSDLESGNPVVTIHSLTRQLQRYALFVTLMKFDGNLQPEPYFASRWWWDKDHRILGMALRENLRWHDGVPTTANDVQFTLNAARDPRIGSPRAADLADLDSTHVLSDTLLQLYFRVPQPRVPNVLAELPLVPKHLLDTVPRSTWRQSSFATAPVGNGPFRFVDRTPGRRWRFERNDDFPVSMGGAPRLQRIVVAVVDEAATKFAGLVSGELDVAGVSPVMAHLVVEDPTLTLLTPPALFSNVLAFNTTKPPFDDVRIRRAISLAINRPRIVETAVAGYATAAGSAIPPGLPVSPSQDPEYNTALADSLLEAAGWHRKGGSTRRNAERALEIQLLTVGSGDMAVEQLIQADLAERGITVRIRVAEMATFLTTVRAPEKTFDMIFTGIPGDIGLGQLSALFATSQQGGALDYTGFHQPGLDALLTSARNASADSARYAWARVDAQLRNDMPVAWLYHARGVQGLSALLEHVEMDLRGELVTVTRWQRKRNP